MCLKYLFIILLSFYFISNEQKIKDPKKFISDVIIDTHGDFKYILLEMTNKTNLKDYKYIIRGSNQFDFHKSLYLDFMQNNVYKYPDIYNNFYFKVLGGGRISFKGYDILVYGESGVYGKANHKLTCNLLKLKFPSYNINGF